MAIFVERLLDRKGPLRRCFGLAWELPSPRFALFSAAFEDMLENPLSSTQWMNDPETGPVLLQISRIFQTLNRA